MASQKILVHKTQCMITRAQHEKQKGCIDRRHAEEVTKIPLFVGDGRIANLFVTIILNKAMLV